MEQKKKTKRLASTLMYSNNLGQVLY